MPRPECYTLGALDVPRSRAISGARSGQFAFETDRTVVTTLSASGADRKCG